MLQGYSEDLIKNASKKHSPVVVLNLASRFAQVNGLETQVPPSLMITYLLSAPELEEIPNNQLNELMDTSTTAHSIVDIRLDLNLTETAVRRCLLRLHHKNQSLVLRKCLIRLEQNHSCSRDYDRHEMVLKLYSECLSKMREMLQSATQLKALEGEVTRIHQRQGALSLMSSIFRGYPPERKPKYNMLFQPLPDDPIHCQSDKRRTNVLGSEASSDVFDPLLSLHDVLLDDNGTNSIATSLQPLCKYLQLPSGYIHARALIVRLRKLKEAGESLPSVETSVITVLKKLESAADKAELAWWCSLQYPDGTKEQMGCLDLAHANATEASEEVETFSNHDESCMVDENKALERVKRIDETRAMYLDKKLVDDVLSQIKCSSSVRGVYKKIIAKIQECPVAGDKYRPEHLVRELLIEGSLAAAIASLDESDVFAVYHFRSLATLTHEACKSLSDRYSHINVGKCARALAHNWLVHGDEKRGFIQSQDEINYGGAVVASEKKDRTHDKDEELNLTSEFVMDIGMLSAGHQGWISEQSGDDHEPGVISSEEPSALKALSSLREASDNVCARVSLRIAFLICFAEDYHRLHESKSFDGNDENINGNIILKREKRKKNSSVARKFCFNKNNCFVGSHALDHARELLEIVFAKKESTIASCKFLFENSIVEDNTLLTGLSERSSPDNKPTRNKALSFAMRHRALRVATILCPTDVLLRVVSENGFINGLGDNCLEIYSFGTFIAMEIESMGLPLPHSDLVKISKMHFPSFARTIWRNHGGVSMPGLNGRLYLLLLQMGVRSKSLESAEWDFVKLIFSELMRLDLPRSLLLACECMIQSNAIQLAASSKMSDVLACVSNAAKRVCDLIAEEIQSSIKIGIELDAPQCLSTVERLVCVINVGHIENSIEFVKKLTALAIHCSQAGPAVLFKGLLEAASRIVNHMDDPVAFSAASSILSELSVGTTTIARPLPKLKPLPMRWKNDHSSPSVCSGEVEKFEKSFL